MKHIAVVVPTRAYTKNYFYANLDPLNPNILYNVISSDVVPIKEDFFRVFNWTIQERRGGDRPNN
jgi:hypothetical protein